MTEPTSQKRRARRARFQGAALLAAVLAVTLIRAEDLRFLHSSGDMEAIARTLEEGVALRSQSIGSLSFIHVWRETPWSTSTGASTRKGMATAMSGAPKAGRAIPGI